MTTPPKHTTHAKLHWINGQPLNTTYGDPYFSDVNGLEETEYVFIKHNGLPERWKEQPGFTIAETGFGTGLNFITTCKHWLSTTTNHQKLTFISVEIEPLTKADLQKSLAMWPELNSLSQELLENYPPNIPGHHHIELFEGRVSLLLLIGEATAMYQQLNAKVDAWYLDGFAPSKNERMWSSTLFSQIARLSQQGTTFSTYTVAGSVRRGLQAVGFEVKKSIGFGRKREMIFGSIQTPPPGKNSKPWFDLSTLEPSSTKEVCIIGAGIAGLTTAYLFSKRGWNVTVVDKHSTVAGGASGNPIGLVMPRFTADMNRGARFYIESFLTTVRWLNYLTKNYNFENWHQSSALHLMPEEKLTKLNALNFPSNFVEKLSASKIASHYSVKTHYDGLLIHQAGYVEPAKLCQFLFNLLKGTVDFRFSKNISKLTQNGSTWQLTCDNQNSIHSKNIIIANANGAEQLLAKNTIKTSAVRGQISYIPELQMNIDLKLPIICENYVTPVVNGIAILGASYDRNELDTELRKEEHLAVISQMKRVMHNPFKNDLFTDGRVSYRCTTHDRLPIVGPVPDWEFYQTSYRDIKHGKHPANMPVAKYQSGLFLNTGHGSRGLVSSYSSAHLLYAMISGEPLSFDNEIIEALHPAKFIIKNLKRGL